VSEGQQSREDRRKDTENRKVSERRVSKILEYELLNLDRPDKRSDPNRRSGKKRRLK
jgi:hypothetical protein